MNQTNAVVVLVWIAPLVILYLLVRLAVRHGVRDAERDRLP